MYPIRKGEQVLNWLVGNIVYTICFEILFTIYVNIMFLQVLDNYGEHYAIMPRATRQQKLLKQYYFTCDCIPCQENWPLYHELQSFKVNNNVFD